MREKIVVEEGKSDAADAPVAQALGQDAQWVQALFAHNDTFLRLGAHAKNWRRMAFLGWFVAVLAVIGVIYIGSQSKFVPMVIEVDKLGRTIAVRALTGEDASADPNRIIYAEMFELIENLRTVTTDRAANDSRITKGFARLTGAGAEYVRTELRKAPPNTVGATKTVQIIVTTALKLKGKSWQLEWEEHSFGLNGEDIGVEVWRATVQYDLVPRSDEESIRKNPMGLLIPEINWQRVTVR
jgi:type IV secretory pathway TrbF-like protein